jgi:DNA polymerase (family 10)
MDNPWFTILAHPTGRLINKREPCDIDLEKVLHAAFERGCCVELNAQPERLDLTDSACRLAKDIGVKVSIATDTHRTAHLDYMRLGVDQARRGWLERGDVLNTLPLADLRALLRRQ